MIEFYLRGHVCKDVGCLVALLGAGCAARGARGAEWGARGEGARGTCRPERVKSGAGRGSGTKEYSNTLLDALRMNVLNSMTILFLTCEDNSSSGRFLIFCVAFLRDPLAGPQRLRVFVKYVVIKWNIIIILIAYSYYTLSGLQVLIKTSIFY